MTRPGLKYRDRVAVVTGAGSGIGRALTAALIRDGAHVAAWDVNADGLADTRAACGTDHVTTYQVDVADREAVLACAEQVRGDLQPASMLFNNAGVNVYAAIEATCWQDFDWLIGINLGGVVNGTMAFLPQLIESGTVDRPSRLVNVSSAFGLIAMPYQGAYSTSKFAVRGFTEALRQEMIIDRRPLTVHCVHPGVVRTNFVANMRSSEGEPETEFASRSFDRAARTSADKAAQLILRGVDKDRARILVGADGHVAAALPRLVGARYLGLLARAMRAAKDRRDKSSRHQASAISGR